MAAKRELIEPHKDDKRYVRRNAMFGVRRQDNSRKATTSAAH
jgi:hypothetical protein